MIDYDFYCNSYLGASIPESAFPGAVVRATQALAKIRRQYQVLSGDKVSEKMALCAMAEEIYNYHSRRANVSSATVGGVSVRYEKGQSLSGRLLDRARIYLDIYRGGTVCSVR